MDAPKDEAHPATTMDTSRTIDSSPASIIDPLPESLPSTVDETLSRCPRFRILVVGNTGVGKSSLIANIFSVKQQDIDVADGRPGIADIGREYKSDDNPRFTLHDSKGFEPGSTNHWGTVQDFIHQRSKRRLPIEQQLHALWLCIETPRAGSRLMQTADEELLKLAIARKIPVIVVFTKFDLLFNEFYAKASQQGTRNIDPNRIAEEARSSLRTSIEVFRQQIDLPKPRRFSWPNYNQPLSYVGVSTNQRSPGFLKTLEELTEVTRKCLHTQETFVPWAVAQRIDPKQKVQTSIEEGSKKYWKNMAKSTVFKGHVLKDCLWRIHLDIVKVWNFRDPDMLLIGSEFHTQILKLIEPFVPQSQPNLRILGYLPAAAALAVIFGPILPPLAIAFAAAGFTAMAVNFLYNKYRAAPETSLYLEAYIVYLTLFLHGLFVTALQTEWQKPINSALITATLDRFRRTKSEEIHQLVRASAPSAREALVAGRARQNIGELIRGHLGMHNLE